MNDTFKFVLREEAEASFKTIHGVPKVEEVNPFPPTPFTF